MEVPAIDAHGHTTQLDDNVVAGGECFDGLGPGGEDFFALAGVGADRQWAADMVETNLRARKGLGQSGEVANLRVIQPCVERHVQRRQASESFAERLVIHQPWRRRVGRIHQGRV